MRNCLLVVATIAGLAVPAAAQSRVGQLQAPGNALGISASPLPFGAIFGFSVLDEIESLQGRARFRHNAVVVGEDTRRPLSDNEVLSNPRYQSVRSVGGFTSSFYIDREENHCCATKVARRMVVLAAHCLFLYNNFTGGSTGTGQVRFPGMNQPYQLRIIDHPSNRIPTGRNVAVRSDFVFMEMLGTRSQINGTSPNMPNIEIVPTDRAETLTQLRFQRGFLPQFVSSGCRSNCTGVLYVSEMNLETCQLTGGSGDRIDHNCDTGGGASGCPLLMQEPRDTIAMYGMHLRKNSDNTGNQAVVFRVGSPLFQTFQTLFSIYDRPFRP